MAKTTKTTYVHNTIATDPPGGKRHTVDDKTADKLPLEEVKPSNGPTSRRKSASAARKTTARKTAAVRKPAAKGRKETAAKPAASRNTAAKVRKPAAKKAARARR